MLRRSIVLLCYEPSQTIIHIIVEEKRIKNIPTWRGNVSSEDQRCYWQQKSWSSDDCAQIPQKLSEREDLPSQVFQISNFRLPTWYFRRGIWESEVGKKSDFPTFRLCYITGLFSFLFLTTLQVSQEYAASRILALHIDIEPSNIQLPPQNASPSV